MNIANGKKDGKVYSKQSGSGGNKDKDNEKGKGKESDKEKDKDKDKDKDKESSSKQRRSKMQSFAPGDSTKSSGSSKSDRLDGTIL
jgi:pre-mRNA 3'-end-processing factor FIP1